MDQNLCINYLIIGGDSTGLRKITMFFKELHYLIFFTVLITYNTSIGDCGYQGRNHFLPHIAKEYVLVGTFCGHMQKFGPKS